jgi:cytochrome c oxidase subunit III
MTSVRPVQFVGDLAELPTHGYGSRSLTWWGVIAFIVIEGAMFVMAAFAYLFLMSHQDTWPPAPLAPPHLLAGSLFTVIVMLSEGLNLVLKRVSEQERLGPVRVGLLIMVAIGLVLLVIRAFELGALNVSWTTNSYGSVIWALMVLHTVHLLTDWGDTAVLCALTFTRHGHDPRRFVDVSENALYWRFVWIAWIPLYLLVYILPRLPVAGAP